MPSTLTLRLGKFFLADLCSSRAILPLISESIFIKKICCCSFSVTRGTRPGREQHHSPSHSRTHSYGLRTFSSVLPGTFNHSSFNHNYIIRTRIHTVYGPFRQSRQGPSFIHHHSFIFYNAQEHK